MKVWGIWGFKIIRVNDKRILRYKTCTVTVKIVLTTYGFSIFSSLLRQTLVFDMLLFEITKFSLQIMYYQFANLPQLFILGFVCTMKSSGICFPSCF